MNFQNKTKEELIICFEKLQQKYDELKISYDNDITSSEKSEALLEQTHLNYRSLLNSIDELIFVLDLEGNIININNPVVERLGYSKEELIGKHISVVHPLEHKTEVVNGILNIGKDTADFFIIPVQTKSGVQIPVEIKANKGTWDNKPVIFGVTKDISKLQLSEEKFSKLFYINPSACTLTNIENNTYIEVNDAFCTLLGFKKNEVIGETLESLHIITPETRFQISKNTDKHGEISNIEAVLQAKNGELKHVLIFTEEINLSNNKYRFTVIYDITALKQTTEELKKEKEQAKNSEQKYKQLFDNTLDHIFILDVEKGQRYKILDVNPIQKKEVGKLQPGKYIEECFTSDMCNYFTKNYNDCLSKKKIITYEEIIDNHNFLTQLIPVKNTDGEIYRLIGIARNITNEKTLTNQLINRKNELKLLNTELTIAKEKAEENEHQIRLITNSLIDGMVYQAVADNNGLRKFLFINNAVKEFYGCTPEEAINNPNLIYSKIYKDDIEKLAHDEENAIKNLSVMKTEVRFVNPKGEIRWSYIISSPRKHKEMIYWDGIQIDITDQKKNEEELKNAKEKAEENDKLKTAFLHNMSHEIRTPMNAIMGFSKLIVSEYKDKSKLKKYSNIINQRCSDLLVLIDDILDIAKIESGQLSVNIEECNLNSLFQELKLFFSEQQTKLGKQNIKFTLQAQCEPLKQIIETDKVKLKQIFINLIGNAFKFTDNGIIEGGCKIDSDNNLLFFVSDTGVGISLDKQQKIFERFIQLDPTPNRLYGGTGLGLSIAKGLVNILGGKIWLDSEFGKGTTFYFSLPNNYISPKIEKQIIPQQEINFNNFQNKTILVVEDDIFNSTYIKEVISKTGLKIIHTEYGKEAIKIAKSKPLDLILMDIGLPDIDGYEAARQIKQDNPQIKIIAQTAYAAFEDKQKSIENGCIDYISKPYKSKVLLELLHLHLTED